MKGIIAADEARTIAAIPKNLHGQLVWQKRTNHAGHMVATARVEDADGAILPGLIVVCFRSPCLPKDTARSCVPTSWKSHRRRSARITSRVILFTELMNTGVTRLLRYRGSGAMITPVGLRISASKST